MPETQQKYELTSLNLYKSYGDTKYRLKVQFRGFDNEINLHIDDKLGEEILALCRDRIAEEITRSMQDSLNELIGIPARYEEIEDASGEASTD